MIKYYFGKSKRPPYEQYFSKKMSLVSTQIFLQLMYFKALSFSILYVLVQATELESYKRSKSVLAQACVC